MANSTHQLIEALIQKEGALAELLQVMEGEQRCIMEVNLENLEVQVEKKREALARLQQTAALSRQLMAQVAAELELPGAGKLSELLPKVAAPQREELERLQGRLLEMGDILKRAESTNRSLLEGALLTVNRTLDFFGRIFSRSNTYGEAGRMVGGACAPKLVRREV
jgi:flagellar biosynthesis/type III secretory pathway chaperone